ncbi:MAG: hypothetical protein RLZZ232_1868 [Planctomycetota bacterium]|jgi:hypothetical protein
MRSNFNSPSISEVRFRIASFVWVANIQPVQRTDFRGRAHIDAARTPGADWDFTAPAGGWQPSGATGFQYRATCISGRQALRIPFGLADHSPKTA